MHREREFRMKTNNLAALFHELFERPSYMYMFLSQYYLMHTNLEMHGGGG